MIIIILIVRGKIKICSEFKNHDNIDPNIIVVGPIIVKGIRFE